jgi:hypothetical protein
MWIARFTSRQNGDLREAFPLSRFWIYGPKGFVLSGRKQLILYYYDEERGSWDSGCAGERIGILASVKSLLFRVTIASMPLTVALAC